MTATGPVPARAVRFRAARRLARRTMLRLLRPYTAHADALARGMVEAVQETHEAAEERTLDAALATSAALADARRLGRRLKQLERAATTRSDSESPALTDSGGARSEPAAQTARVSPGAYPKAPEGEPWSPTYTEAHGSFVERALSDPALTHAFRTGGPLPNGFGAGFDERVVEYPWIASRVLAGRVLDAGSTLNHLHVLHALRPRMDELHIVTLAPEDESFPELGVSYMYADLRDLPFKDAAYDRVLSISTLDHVGLDNARFGAHAPPATNPQPEVIRAVHELRRVLRPGGDLYLTVPVGRGDRFSWVRSLTLEELDELVEAFGASAVAKDFFRHTGPSGWVRAERDVIASAGYRDHFTSGPVGSDGVVAAEAIACLHLVRGHR
jgi:SAM-dependent methyltransferase